MRPAVSPNFVAASGVERDGAGRRAVDAAEIDGELSIDEHPHVVVADELQDLSAAVLEPVANLAGEAVVVRHLIAVAAGEIGDLRPARRLRPSLAVDREERRRDPADRRRVAPHLRVVVDERAVRLLGQRQRVANRRSVAWSRGTTRRSRRWWSGTNSTAVDSPSAASCRSRGSLAPSRSPRCRRRPLRSSGARSGGRSSRSRGRRPGRRGCRPAASADVAAVPAGLELAVRRAAVAGDDVAVVALFARQLEAVAAGGGAAAGAGTNGLGAAVRAAAVSAIGVAVIAGLAAFFDAVAAGCSMADRAGSSRQAKPASMRQVSLQPSPAIGVPVVALFGAEHHAVAATRNDTARLPGGRSIRARAGSCRRSRRRASCCGRRRSPRRR